MQLKLPPLPARLKEPEEDWVGPPPVPSVAGGQSAAMTGPVRMRTDLPDQPRPNTEGRQILKGRFGEHLGSRSVDPVPAGTYQTTPGADLELDDSPIGEAEI